MVDFTLKTLGFSFDKFGMDPKEETNTDFGTVNKVSGILRRNAFKISTSIRGPIQCQIDAIVKTMMQ